MERIGKACFVAGLTCFGLGVGVGYATSSSEACGVFCAVGVIFLLTAQVILGIFGWQE